MVKQKKQKSYKLKFVICALTALIFASMFLFEKQILEFVNNTSIDTKQTILQSDLIVHFVDVGQGDAIAIRLPDNKTMIIDSGSEDSAASLTNYLSNKFFENNENNIDYFLITHPHEDHIGGAVEIFENFQVDTFYRPTVYTQNEIDEFANEFGNEYAQTLCMYESNVFLNTISSADNEPECHEVFFSHLIMPIVISGIDYSLTLFTPTQSSYININNFSPIMVLEYSGKKIMLTGDAEALAENEFLSQHEEFDIDILKVGHHGSNSSSSQDFLHAITPEYAIISVGQDNSYNHPTDAVLSRLKNIGAKIYRTDQNGTILVGIDDNNIYVFATNNTLQPVNIEVWEIYVVLCVFSFYIIFKIDIYKLKNKAKKIAIKRK